MVQSGHSELNVVPRWSKVVILSSKVVQKLVQKQVQKRVLSRNRARTGPEPALILLWEEESGQNRHFVTFVRNRARIATSSLLSLLLRTGGPERHFRHLCHLCSSFRGGIGPERARDTSSGRPESAKSDKVVQKWSFWCSGPIPASRNPGFLLPQPRLLAP